MEDKYYSRMIKVMIFIIDFYFIQIVFGITKQLDVANTISHLKYSSFFLIFSLLWIISGFINEIYRINKFSMIRSIGKNLLSTVMLHALLMGLIVLFVDMYRFKIEFFILVYVLTTILIMGVRVAFKL